MKINAMTMCGTLIFLLHSSLCTQPLTAKESFDPDFNNRAFNHVKYFASLGLRFAETTSETETINYLKNQMEGIGCSVRIEPFQFDYFILEKAVVQLGDKKLEPGLVIFNPYEETNVSGQAFFFDPSDPYEEYFGKDVHDKIVITKRPAHTFRLALRHPRAIIFLHEDDFLKSKNECGRAVSLIVEGKVKRLQSANIIGTLAPNSATNKEIIISAHMDSSRGPGADDNASGLGVMLELARYFSKFKEDIPCKLRFVAFGAEELGFIGSKAYIEQHKKDLKDCELLFNMDVVGGDKEIYVEMRGGVEKIPQEQDKLQTSAQMPFKARHACGGKWALDPTTLICVSNIPEWLKNIITITGKELNYDISPSYQMGSDHLMFAAAGIVATDIAISGNKNHCPEDTPDQIHVESLEKAGKIVATVVRKVMNRLSEIEHP